MKRKRNSQPARDVPRRVVKRATAAAHARKRPIDVAVEIQRGR
jgi:hypothetical protein